MFTIIRRTLVALVSLLVLTAVGMAFFTTPTNAVAHPLGDAPTVAVALAEPPARPTAPPCQEDGACFNPCTQGVNGLYPDTDERHYLPGPCDLRTVLPYGGWFRVEVEMLSAPHGCGQGWRAAELTVLGVTAPTGVTVLGEMNRTVCVKSGETALTDAGTTLSAMYRNVARQVDDFYRGA